MFVSSAGVGTIAADIAITGSVTEHLGVTSSLSIGSTSDFTGAISCASSMTAVTFFGDGNGLTNINPSEVNLDGTDQRLDDLDVAGVGTVATLDVSGVSTFTGDAHFEDTDWSWNTRSEDKQGSDIQLILKLNPEIFFEESDALADNRIWSQKVDGEELLFTDMMVQITWFWHHSVQDDSNPQLH